MNYQREYLKLQQEYYALTAQLAKICPCLHCVHYHCFTGYCDYNGSYHESDDFCKHGTRK